jgi:hypothetical protein
MSTDIEENMKDMVAFLMTRRFHHTVCFSSLHFPQLRYQGKTDTKTIPQDLFSPRNWKNLSDLFSNFLKLIL